MIASVPSIFRNNLGFFNKKVLHNSQEKKSTCSSTEKWSNYFQIRKYMYCKRKNHWLISGLSGAKWTAAIKCLLNHLTNTILFLLITLVCITFKQINYYKSWASNYKCDGMPAKKIWNVFATDATTNHRHPVEQLQHHLLEKAINNKCP